jgi:hypothetical protein
VWSPIWIVTLWAERSIQRLAMTARAGSADLWDLRGGVVHRSSCRFDLVVSVWLDVLTPPKGGRRPS